jgi:hypothetical protein
MSARRYKVAGGPPAVVVVLALQAACGSSGGRDAGLDAIAGDGSDTHQEAANPDTPTDAPADTVDDAPVDTVDDAPPDARDTGNDTADTPSGLDVVAGCAVTNGVWSIIPLSSKWSNPSSMMWSIGPMRFVYSDSSNRLWKWNDAARALLAPQPPPEPFRSGPWVQGSGENDIWVGGVGPLIRPGVTDHMDVDVARWNGVSWQDLSFVIPITPAIQSSNDQRSGGAASAFWRVGPDEAWQWIRNTYSSAPASYVPYHLEGGTWKAVPSPLDTLSGTPVATWGATRSDLWVGGSVSRQVPPEGDASAATTASDPLLLHWDGSIWTRVELPIASGNGTRGVASIWGSAANDVWAVGQTDASADTWHFDGERWTEVPVAGPKSFKLVWGTCASDFWAVGTSEPQPWHYDGRAWSPVPLPQGLRATGALTGTGPGDVWLSVEKAQTCTPPQGVSQMAAHWGPNRCGDGVVAGAETCDPPRDDGDGLQCDATCRRPTCGNGVVDAGEECDPPTLGSCDRQCRNVAPACGDNAKQTGEECDFTDARGYLCRNCEWWCLNHCLLTHPSTGSGRCARITCESVSGLDAARCWPLLGCMINYTCARYLPGLPTGRISTSGCFTACALPGCSATVDGPCAAEARALLARVDPGMDTSDPWVITEEADLGAGLLSDIARQAASANSVPTTGCRIQECAIP